MRQLGPYALYEMCMCQKRSVLDVCRILMCSGQHTLMIRSLMLLLGTDASVAPSLLHSSCAAG